jgi:ABC-type multidrug transport system ATPase subunit
MARRRKKVQENFDVCMDNVRKSFGKKEVLKGINFHIENGERIAVIGANGSGKSTLINVMTGLYKRYRGKVTYCGFNSKADFQHKVGVQFQENN